VKRSGNAKTRRGPSRKKATGKPRKSGGTGGVRRSSPTATATVPESDVAKETWMFSKDKEIRYVDPKTKWTEFRDGGNGMLRFHTGSMPPPDLKTAIEKFAAELDEWLLDHDFEGRDTAPGAIRQAVTPPSDPLANLLRAVDANYREAT
jgi:hypothetical protein